MAKLTKQARRMLEESKCFDEVSDDCLSVANSGILVLLSSRAVADLNRQARDKAAEFGDA